MNDRLNVVFHHIRRSDADCTNLYDLSENEVCALLTGLNTKLRKQGLSTRVFFDDGYLEHYHTAITLQEKFGISVVLGVPTKTVGQDGYMTWWQLQELVSLGHVVASHSVSHVGLGVYENDTVCTTPSGGQYQDAPSGKGRLLSKEEVAYQVVESHRVLAAHGVSVDKFVYPYGIFNTQIRDIVADSGLYTRGYTCEAAVEKVTHDPFTIPRIVIDRSVQLDKWAARLIELSTELDQNGRVRECRK